MFTSKEDRLAKAIANAEFDLAKKMISNRIGVNGRDRKSRGASSLMLAVQKGHYPLVVHLLRRKADVRATDDRGRNVFHYLSSANKTDLGLIVGELLDAGANINHVCEDWGRTPLAHYVINDTNVEIVRLLIKKGAQVDAAVKYYPSLVWLAADYGAARMIKILAGHGVPLDAQNREGRTALHAAAHQGYAECVKILLECGADATVVNNKLNTAADEATLKEHLGIAQYIRQHCGNVAPAAPEGENPWRKLAPDEIAHVAERPAIGYRLTMVFNFTHRTCTVMARNTRDGQESVNVRGLTELGEPELLRAAAEELRRQGGHVPDIAGPAATKLLSGKGR